MNNDALPSPMAQEKSNPQVARDGFAASQSNQINV